VAGRVVCTGFGESCAQEKKSQLRARRQVDEVQGLTDDALDGRLPAKQYNVHVSPGSSRLGVLSSACRRESATRTSRSRAPRPRPS